MNLFGVLVNQFVNSPPLNRRFLLIAIDAFLILLVFFLGFWLLDSHEVKPTFEFVAAWFLPTSILVGLPLYLVTGQYKGLTRYVGSVAFYRLALRNTVLVLIVLIFGLFFSFPIPPLRIWLLIWLLLTGFMGAIRFALRDLLLSFSSVSSRKMVRVAIYGAGEAGAQLAAALRLAGNHRIITFLDDNPDYWKRSINDIPIQPPQILGSLEESIDQVLLAIPSLQRSERRRIVSSLQKRGILVLQVPSVDDLTSGRARIDALRPVSIEDLLGRDPVSSDIGSIYSGINSSVVCVTGAGGSIGSELCRQILTLHPSKLILLERNEPSLYAIDQELRPLLGEFTELKSILGSSSDSALVNQLFIDENIDLVFHAAAYKHVPLVEANPIAGLTNNVISTRVVCSAAASVGVGKVILISSDKAVRPANIMGASKRLAELVVQASSQQETSTCFAMVRFGNVLGSSGSVVPLFRSQIAAGGPLTLTHPEIIRFFMTIPEAAQLVLQASGFAKGGEVFLLDMGEPVRIKDLAEQMIRLSGLTVRDVHNPGGDIEIICTGLRPGEKLYEELLIEANSEPTPHPLIFKARESFIPPHILWLKLNELEKSLALHDTESCLLLLSELVPEWQAEKPVS